MRRREVLGLAALAAGPALGAGVAPTPTDEVAPASVVGTGPWVHAYAAFGEPKYKAGFDHFDYADPQAKKGGTLFLDNPDLRNSFDKYNYYTIKGQSPAGVNLFMIESLAIPSGDEPATVYGLVAEAMQVAPDRSSIAFRIHPKARFTNGDPVTADDIKYVFDSLTGKYAAPEFQTKYAGVERATVIDPRTIRFELKERTFDTVITVAELPVFSRKWGLTADGKTKPFDQIINEEPITTGPYKIGLADSGRRIEFVRRPDYWAQDLGIRRGFFNFDRIVYRYYQDLAIAMEAFKAGEFDIYEEFSARRWAQVHAGAKWRDGRIKKELFPTGTGAGLQSYQFNLRRPIFADIRVRQAIELAFDFEWINKRHQYKRTYSVFSNSDFAAQGLPSPGELKLLEPFRAELPAAVFGPAYEPPRTDTGPIGLRENLRKARDLLIQAGYTLGPDDVLRNAAGQRLEFEYLNSQDGAARTTAAWRANLAKIGIAMNVRQVDNALYEKRSEVFDFDMIATRYPDFTLPSAAQYVGYYGSKAAGEHGSGNLIGLRSRAADAALAVMSSAHTLQELTDACRALDRIVMHSHVVVPDLYSPDFRVSYWDRFVRPKVMPPYYTINSALEPVPAWPIMTWWLKPGATR